MTRTLILLLIIFSSVIITIYSCQKKEDNSPFECNDSLPVTDTLTNQTGTFLYDDINHVYTIQVVPKGTIDEISLYIVCTPPGRLPNIGKQVVFSGYVRPAAIVAGIAGTTYYQISLTSFHE